MDKNCIAKKLKINGIVQGVGFRPFVYQLANRYNIKGEVANTSYGVVIHIEGYQDNIDSFCSDLTLKSPPLARITEIKMNDKPVKAYATFSITKSKSVNHKSTLISPDVSVCKDCLDELFNPDDRRYKYPFINCTNCGPRYTIIDDIPYDRPNTSMKHFKMCSLCQAEYDDPENRRFHAQPNACARCGPGVELYDNKRKKIFVKNPIEETANLLKKGHIVAVKGLGGFHLAVDAVNTKTVVRLRKQKHREEKPFALMSFGLQEIEKYAVVEDREKELLLSIQRPIVILKKKNQNPVSVQVSPKNKYFGVMLPYTPLHYLLLSSGFIALIMTSGNMKEEPIAIDNKEAFERLSHIADYFLIHNRDIYLRNDDSIIKNTAGTTRFIRRSRGYIPTPVFLNNKVPPILACGAELKNTVCVTKENRAFLSQHIGDLENIAAYDFFTMTIKHLKRILDITPELLAHDLHPDYLSTRYAMEQTGIIKTGVQHHHAHIVSCMAENRLEDDVIGLSFDGTGYGTDGKIWGCEILIADCKKFRRAAHLDYVPIPGGDAAIKEPWRMAVSYLYQTFGHTFKNLDLPLLHTMDQKKIFVIEKMISTKLNSPDTSSLGRLFDGIASIIGIRNTVFFEGQAAMELEMIADESVQKTYDYEWVSKDIHTILLQPIITGIIKDLKNGIDSAIISGKFHFTLICLFSELCEVIRKDTSINRIVLSGGVFQNSILLKGLTGSLSKRNFKVYTHKTVPTNDGGISLGQAIIAANQMKNQKR